VGLLAGEHFGGAAREPLSGGGSGRGRRAHVRGARAARDHAAGERRRYAHPPARQRLAEGPALMATTTGPDFVEPIDLGTLERSLRQPRSLFSGAMSTLTGLMTAAALVPLFSVLYLLVVRGGRQLGLALFTELPPAALTAGGGFGNAIVGTVIMVAI